jgi:putative methyltransferase
LVDVIAAAQLLKHEKKLASKSLALVLVHDVLFARGIQAGDGPLKQAVLRHKTRLSSELQRIKIKRGAMNDTELAATADARAGAFV